MELNVVWQCARAAVIELADGGLYETADYWDVFVNGTFRFRTNHVETYVDGLEPGQRNVVRYERGSDVLEVGVTCAPETLTLNVRDFGAKADGRHDDTSSIQAAIMACPAGGRVLVPAGKYRVKASSSRATWRWSWPRAPSFSPALTARTWPTCPAPSRAWRAPATPAPALCRWAPGRARTPTCTAPPSRAWAAATWWSTAAAA